MLGYKKQKQNTEVTPLPKWPQHTRFKVQNAVNCCQIQNLAKVPIKLFKLHGCRWRGGNPIYS